jgi:hypothetical protein
LDRICDEELEGLLLYSRISAYVIVVAEFRNAIGGVRFSACLLGVLVAKLLLARCSADRFSLSMAAE